MKHTGCPRKKKCPNAHIQPVVWRAFFFLGHPVFTLTSLGFEQ